MDSFHSTLQAIKWVSSVDEYICYYSYLYYLLSSIPLYIQHCKQSSDYLHLILYSASHFGDINTKLIKRTFWNLSPGKKWRRQRRRPSITDSNKRSNRRTTKADNKGSRQDLLGNIYPIYPIYFRSQYILYTYEPSNRRPTKADNKASRQDIGIYEAARA